MTASNTRRNAGSATITMLVLLSILLIFVLANLKTLGFLKRELNLVEKRQLHLVIGMLLAIVGALISVSMISVLVYKIVNRLALWEMILQ